MHCPAHAQGHFRGSGERTYESRASTWFAADPALGLLRTQCLHKLADVKMLSATILLKMHSSWPDQQSAAMDLHGHRFNQTLFSDTMEVLMIRLPWLAIAQHVFPPAFDRQARLTRLQQQISREIVSCGPDQRKPRWADFVKNCLPWTGSKKLRRFHEKSCSWAPCPRN